MPCRSRQVRPRRPRHPSLRGQVRFRGRKLDLSGGARSAMYRLGQRTDLLIGALPSLPLVRQLLLHLLQSRSECLSGFGARARAGHASRRWIAAPPPALRPPRRVPWSRPRARAGRGHSTRSVLLRLRAHGMRCPQLGRKLPALPQSLGLVGLVLTELRHRRLGAALGLRARCLRQAEGAWVVTRIANHEDSARKGQNQSP